MQISKEVALKLAQAYDEIEVAENLRDHIVDCLKNRTEPDIRDGFGKKQAGLQLGVPTGNSSHRLFDVPWEICEPIINAHIHEKKTLIELLNVEAQKELNAPPPQNNENSRPIPAGVYVKQNSDELEEPPCLKCDGDGVIYKTGGDGQAIKCDICNGEPNSGDPRDAH